MSNQLDVSKYKQYFHYHLNYEKNDILDAIIMDSSEEFKKSKMDRKKVNLLKEEVERSKDLYLQFQRFIELVASKKGWYKKIGKKDVATDIEKRIEELQKSNLINVVSYQPMWGIYITDREVFEAGEYLGIHRFSDIPDWIKNDILPILKYLRQLEEENPYQYCSLFMDTKYAITLTDKKEKEAEKIKAMYGMFMEMVKPAQNDVIQFFEGKMTKEEQQLVQDNCVDYWTITDLKQQAKTDKYEKKVQDCYCNLRKIKER